MYEHLYLVHICHICYLTYFVRRDSILRIWCKGGKKTILHAELDGTKCTVRPAVFGNPWLTLQKLSYEFLASTVLIIVPSGSYKIINIEWFLLYVSCSLSFMGLILLAYDLQLLITSNRFPCVSNTAQQKSMACYYF